MVTRPPRVWLASITAAVCSGAPGAQEPPDPAAGSRISLSEVSPTERATLKALLDSAHWPFRVFGVLRLDRYDEGSVEAMVRARLRDQVWQVRCFAAREAGQRGLSVSAEDLAEETNPFVIRALLQAGLQLPAAQIERGTRVLMRSNDLEEFMLGVEIAAASDVEALRSEATRRVAVFIRNMNEVRAVLVSRRLARLLDLGRSSPSTSLEWKRWLAARGKEIELPPAQRGRRAPAHSPIARSLLGESSAVAGLDGELFTRLRDYLDVLKSRDLEVVIAMDTTMSMMPMINEARAGVDDLILFLSDISRSMRLGFVAYRDHDNPPVVETHKFTADVEAIRRYLFNLRVSGGQDRPEAVLEGLSAAGQLDWNPAASRQVILVGDAPPHDRDTYQVTSLLEEARSAGTPVHAVHVPMRRQEGFYENLHPQRAAADRQNLDEYNQRTESAFAEIARLGGGQMTRLTEVSGLVPAIMHFSIEEAWWPVFDEFYTRYLELCR